MANDRIDNVDVICAMKSDGSIIPIRLQFPDEDGEMHRYTIKGYRLLCNDGLFNHPDAGYMHSNYQVYKCHIIVFNKETDIMLYYDKHTGKWWIDT